MTVRISHTADVQKFFENASGFDEDAGNPRMKTVVHRILTDAIKIIEDLQISPEEFWKAVNYFNELGARQEAGLLVAGLGLEHYLDLLLDAEDEQNGQVGGTPRTIEGPLYVAGAPLSQYEARLDDGTDAGTPLFMHGQVRDVDGQPLANATVDVWHANTGGTYSYFDPTQSEFNLRRRIQTDAQGRYRFQSIVPSGYGCPPDGPTQGLLDQLGRHGQRPAHVHFFISAPGHRHLTTQINLAGDPYLHDDFAYATRDELIAQIHFIDDAERAAQRGVSGRFAEIEFDFALQSTEQAAEQARRERVRALEA
ncbi:catechol 1,2-dioxygenase [Pseudomonas sp. 21LCFQ02]|uniref:catechol 1,2-dioxygenase n=1 Tax=unclassified Pseudomonas TaxID=196821 RepID=UPI0004F6EAF7|nr:MULTISPECIES: catechol 1,2-dioxygenase [unclassified Pseudomonas]MCO8164310.1 catechol 1,2-dioxygenase [Pseudomonas sp. 21LCFQ010]MCO8170355.1 catechol 1,2-dioxygenase [Pseudomonas sp. 21LCFQ02]MCQ9425459.1 catechol 1,2-dioxygenase [Pseudomonas sp. LJDD11]BAP45628.1 catechol 1,2-dioxygenase [Pseudomonas sp. StFLB209]